MDRKQEESSMSDQLYMTLELFPECSTPCFALCISLSSRLRRDFPEKGDCCYGIFQNHHGVGQEILKICRSEGVRD